MPQSRAAMTVGAAARRRARASACSTCAPRPGGKTTHLAALMEGRGDRRRRRAPSRPRRRAARARPRAWARTASSRSAPPTPPARRSPAPTTACSSTRRARTWARSRSRPDARWRKARRAARAGSRACRRRSCAPAPTRCGPAARSSTRPARSRPPRTRTSWPRSWPSGGTSRADDLRSDAPLWEHASVPALPADPPAPRRDRGVLHRPPPPRGGGVSDEEVDLGRRLPGLPRAVAARDEPARPLPLRELPAPLRARARSARTAASTRRSCACRAPPCTPATTAGARCSSRSDGGAEPPASPRRSSPPTSPASASRSPPCSTAGARTIHVDVMDGHFVPPLSMGPAVVAALADQVHDAGGYLDVHLMVERPERHVADFAEAGADGDHDPRRRRRRTRNYALAAVRDAGCRAGLALNPGTPAVAALASSSTTLDLVALHDRQPRLGRPGVPARLDREARAAARAARRRRRRSRSTAASTRDRRAVRPRGRDRVRRRLGGVRRADPGRGLPRDRRRSARRPECGQPYGRGHLLASTIVTDAMACTILIVDDHPRFRASARVVLESEGFDVVGEAADGASAIAECCRLRPEVVLLDVQLPDTDGFDVCRADHRARRAPDGDHDLEPRPLDFGPLVTTLRRLRLRPQGRALGRARAGAARPVTGLRRALGLVAIEGIVVGLVAARDRPVLRPRRARKAVNAAPRPVHRLVVHRRRPVRLVAAARTTASAC